MKVVKILPFLLLFFDCSPSNFSAWRVENFEATPITQSETKTISLRNENDAVQKVTVGFDGSGDGHQHFSIDKVAVGDRTVGLKDIVIPPGSSLNVQVTYEPKDLETTKADFGGWVTGQPDQFVPYKPGEEPKGPEKTEAVHRVVLLAVYEAPQSGITQIELVGKAVAGPNGEVSLPQSGSGECAAGQGIACFSGNFSMDIPKLFTTGPIENPLAGSIRFAIQGSDASLDMENLPPILIILKGNGPGEPLEGQPVSAVSIVIKGVQGVTAHGTFDGSQLELSGLSFRIQVVVGEITQDDIPNINPIVDFSLENLTLTTEEPFTDGRITLKIDNTLSEKPSGNPIFDEFLGGKNIIVRFKGNLSL